MIHDTSVDAPLTIWRLDDTSKSYALASIDGKPGEESAALASFSREIVMATSREFEFWTVPADGMPKMLARHRDTPGQLLHLEFSKSGAEVVGSNATGLHIYSRKDSTWISPPIEAFRGAERLALRRHGDFAAFSTRAEVLVVSRAGQPVLRVPLKTPSLAPVVALSADGQTLAIDHRVYVDTWKVGDAQAQQRVQNGGLD